MLHFFPLFWAWLALGALMLVLVTTCFWREQRFNLAALFSFLVVFFLVVMWVRDLNAEDSLDVRCSVDSPSAFEEYGVALDASGGSFNVSCWEYHVELPGEHGGNGCTWMRNDKKRGPESHKPVFNKYGFQIIWINEPDHPGWFIERHFWTFIFPAWFPIPFLLVLPALWLRRFLHRRKIRHWIKTGHCSSCGYDLRASKDKCPECGTAIPTIQPRIVKTAKPANQTQAETN